MPVARKFPVYMTNNVSTDSYIKVTPNIINLLLNQLNQQFFYRETTACVNMNFGKYEYWYIAHVITFYEAYMYR